MNKIFIICLSFIVILSACTKDDQSVDKTDDAKIKIVSVNYPLNYFAQRIGGNQINAVFPLPADVDPAYWQPDVDGARC